MCREIKGTYGGYQTPCTIFVVEECEGFWYCVKDSQNINFTYEELKEGVDVETLKDSDYFCWSGGIHSLEELRKAVEG